MKAIEYEYEVVKTEILKRFNGAPDGIVGVILNLTIEVLKEKYDVNLVEVTQKELTLKNEREFCNIDTIY